MTQACAPMFAERNLTMLMDYYELTMAGGYFACGVCDTPCVFDLFYRANPDNAGFALLAGLEQAVTAVARMRFTEADIEYLRGKGVFSEPFLRWLRAFSFTGDLYAVPEGTVVYPFSPLITVRAPLAQAQLLETMLLNQINHQSLIATKASRICRAARGAAVMELGARRAQGADAAHFGARAAYLGGVSGTATVSAAEAFQMPVSGTMAHSWVQFFGDELAAFRAYAQCYPDACTLLIDTYHVLESGLPNAIRTAREVLAPMGRRLRAVRVDSGDLAVLTRAVRAGLDQAGLTDCAVIASGGIDEYEILSLQARGACIDVYGVGERLITAESQPIFGGVYKLSAVYENGSMRPRIKRSENEAKTSMPGDKELWRAYDADGRAVADLIALSGERADAPGFAAVDAQHPNDRFALDGLRLTRLQQPVLVGGRLCKPLPALADIRAYVARQLSGEVMPDETLFENPRRHPLLLSLTLSEWRRKMIASGGVL